MVLQRDEPVHIWGKATPGDRVSISFGVENRFTIVPKDSSWNIYLKEQKANTKAQSIFISCGDKRVELKNILIGDVWLASGQSNMEWPMIREIHWKEETKNTNQPLIRLNNPVPAGRYVYGVAYKDSLNRRLTNDSFYLWTRWNVCDSYTVKDMSAVAYYFAKAIVEKENIPIGIINLSIGGAPIETFISKEALRSNEKFASKVSGNWLENESLPEWIRQRGKENVGNNANGFKDDLGLNHAYKPGFAYACGIEPLLSFSIKGIIWYQGESNSLEKDRVEEYRALLHLMIGDYRTKWKQPDMPFYWVQLSSIDTANYQSKLWPQFRDEQRKLLSEIKSGGMAVSSDIGLRNNVHPTNKKDVGERLARWALNRIYKENIIPSGPLPLQAEFEDEKILVSFQYARELKTSDNKQLRGFSLDGRTDVQVIVENNRVVINSKEKPEYVYYGWRPFSDANLVNEGGLPASTFKIRVKY
jgi:sialate O-acetylesterase